MDHSSFCTSSMMNTTSSISCIPTSSSSRSTTALMDSLIWRNLPEPLLDRVLAFLPPPSFFRFRSVSKRLYSLLFSSSFLQLHLHLSPHHLYPSFLFFPTSNSNSNSNSYYAFLLEPASSTWHRLPLHDCIPASGFSPSASSGGLVCFVSNDPGPKTLILLNPLSKVATQLPHTPRQRLLPSVGLAVGDSSLSLVLAGDDMISPYAVKNLTSETFHADGVTGFYSPWTTVSPLPRLCSLETGRMVLSGGKFYCMSCAPFSVLAYDIATNEWANIQAPMRRFLRSPSLVALGPKILMVAAVDKRKLTVPKSVRVWELHLAATAGWDEVERMPLEVYRQFDEAERGRGFECVASGTAGCANGDYIALTIANSTNVIVFDFGRREWRWALPCPFAASAPALRGFAYEPRLATPAVALIDSPPMPFQAFAG